MITEEQFQQMYDHNEYIFNILLEESSKLHSDTNQTYGEENLPYKFHLRLAGSWAARFFRYITDTPIDTTASLDISINEYILKNIFAAVYFHDVIEDTRTTYNDLIKILNRLDKKYDIGYDSNMIADIVYAVTDEKGHNRKERANDKHWEELCNTKYAPFVKACDRLANIQYASMMYPVSRMYSLYKKEMSGFCERIKDYVPKEMIEQLNNI